MDDRTLYAKLLGLTAPWGVEKVELKLQEGEVHITVALPKKELWVCPECLERAPIHDHNERTWRHLDTFQYKTYVHARVPRLDCPTHGVRQLRVPWAEEDARFTALFEGLLILWLQQASSVEAVARQAGISWDQAKGVMDRAVARGLARRPQEPLRYVGIDETSQRRGHKYFTIVSNLETSKVLQVNDDRKTESLDAFWKTLTPEQLAGIEAVAMDMWLPYINSTREHLPGADRKIVFDKFHIAQHLGKAVDDVRKAEHRELMAEGKEWLKGTKYLWLHNPEKLTVSKWRAFLRLLKSHSFRTGRAWAISQTLMALFDYVYPGVAEKKFREWYSWAIRSRLEPIKRVARMIRDHWDNIRTYFEHRITNAGAESVNALIQKVKRMAHGFRNQNNFRTAILFHLGGLDLLPEGARALQRQ